MAVMEYRTFAESDAAAVVQLEIARDPHRILTEDGLLHNIRHPPDRQRRRDWVAIEGGELVGRVTAGFNWAVPTEGKGWVSFTVAPSHWSDAGAGLFDIAVDYLRSEEAHELRCWTVDPKAVPLLEERGLTATRSTVVSAVDPRLPDLSALPALEEEKNAEGFRLAPLEAVDDPRAIHAVYAAGEADMPGDEHETELDFESWEAETLRHPEISAEGSILVMHGDQPVSLAFLAVEPERKLAYNEMTATLPDFRRRRLASLVKLAALRWAAEGGFERMLTENDDDNFAMRSINERLGYELVHVRHQFFRKLA